MFKLIKVVLLLAILAVIGVGIYYYASPGRETGGPAQLTDPQKREGIRVEQKYGIDSEGINP